MIGSWLLQLFNYRESHFESDLIDIGDNIYSEFDSIYWSTWLIGNLEDQSRL